MKKMFFLLFASSVAFSSNAYATTVASYVLHHVALAKAEMRRTKVLASITLGQSILESTYGTSHLAKKSHNYFGIKKYRSNKYRTYKNDKESFIDHSNVLRHRKRYAFLFKLHPHDYIGWAKGIAKAGYAKNPRYAQDLIACIKKYKLYQYDAQVI